MLELLVLGGLGFALTWYKGSAFAVRAGLIVMGIVFVVAAVLTFGWASEIGPSFEIFAFLSDFASFVFFGSVVFLVASVLIAMIISYCIGVFLAEFMKQRRKDAL